MFLSILRAALLVAGPKAIVQIVGFSKPFIDIFNHLWGWYRVNLGRFKEYRIPARRRFIPIMFVLIVSCLDLKGNNCSVIIAQLTSSVQAQPVVEVLGGVNNFLGSFATYIDA